MQHPVERPFDPGVPAELKLLCQEALSHWAGAYARNGINLGLKSFSFETRGEKLGEVQYRLRHIDFNKAMLKLYGSAYAKQVSGYFCAHLAAFVTQGASKLENPQWKVCMRLVGLPAVAPTFSSQGEGVRGQGAKAPREPGRVEVLAHATKMAHTKAIALPASAQSSVSSLHQFMQGAQALPDIPSSAPADRPPTAVKWEYACHLSEKTGWAIPDEAKQSGALLSKWMNAALERLKNASS